MTEQMTKLRDEKITELRSRKTLTSYEDDLIFIWSECAKIYEARVQELEDKLECLLCHATGSLLSYASYSKETMCEAVDDYIERRIERSTRDGGG